MIVFEREILLDSLLTYIKKINHSRKTILFNKNQSLKKVFLAENPYCYLLISCSLQISLIKLFRALPWPESKPLLTAVTIRLLEVYGSLLNFENIKVFSNKHHTLPLLIEILIDLNKDLINKRMFKSTFYLKDVKEILIKLALLPSSARKDSLLNYIHRAADSDNFTDRQAKIIYQDKCITFPIPDQDYSSFEKKSLIIRLQNEHYFIELSCIFAKITNSSTERLFIEHATSLLETLYSFLNHSKRCVNITVIIKPIIACLVYLHGDILNPLENVEEPAYALHPSLAVSLNRGIKEFLNQLYTSNALAPIENPSTLLNFFKELELKSFQKLEHFLNIAKEDKAKLDQLKKCLNALRLIPLNKNAQKNMTSMIKRPIQDWARKMDVDKKCLPYIKDCEQKLYKPLLNAVNHSLLNPQCLDAQCNLIFLLNEVKHSLSASHEERADYLPSYPYLNSKRAIFGISWRLFLPHPLLALLIYSTMQFSKFTIYYIKDLKKEYKKNQHICNQDTLILNLLIKHLHNLGCFSTNLEEKEISIKNVYNYYLQNFPEKTSAKLTGQRLTSIK